MAFGDEPLTVSRAPDMERRPLMDRRIAAGRLALAAVGLLIGGAFAGLAVEALQQGTGAFAAFDAYLLRIARFTLWQALLSTLLSVVPAILLARALARHPAFMGRAFILRLFAVPLALPAIVAALGILALLGRAGIFAPFLSVLFNEHWPGIYGLSAFWSPMSSSICRWPRACS